ncbi:hypothetical protein BDZ88DRAFT_175146 [Geranomyces variabilis]|nr:hypothetical protein BDZ88DRAFT_175146 [Geranomyces variabilis]
MSDEVPTDLPTCLDALNTCEWDTYYQTITFSYDSDSVSFIISLCVEFLFLSLLFDRLIGMTHRPTKVTFWAAVTTSILWNVICLLSRKVTWIHETLDGHLTFFWIRGVLAAFNQFFVIRLLYLRVADALQRFGGRPVVMAALASTWAVLISELCKHLTGTIMLTISRDDDQTLYYDWMLYTATAYRILIDCAFSFYSFWVIHQASSGVIPSNKKRGLREDVAFLIGYAARVLIFLGVDGVTVTAMVISRNYDDTSFEALTLWAVTQLLGPVKPYLICTDMSRIRALSELGQVDESASGKSSGVKTGSTVVDRRLNTATMESNDPESR